MRAHDQAQPPPPPPPPPAPPQQPLGQPQGQLLQTMCHICFENIQPNEAVTNCNRCRKSFHYGGLLRWLTEAPANSRPQNCPACRADMRWVLGNQQPVVAPVVGPVMGPVVAPVVGPVVAPVVGPVVAPVVGPVVAPVVGPVMNPPMGPVIGLAVAPVMGPVVDLPNTPPGIQPAELLDNIDNWNWHIALE